MENKFLDNGDIYICTNCNNKNSIKFKYCPKCGSIKTKTIDTRWKCTCGVMNNEEYNYCYACGREKEKTESRVDVKTKNEYQIDLLKNNEEQDENKYTISLVKNGEKGKVDLPVVKELPLIDPPTITYPPTTEDPPDPPKKTFNKKIIALAVVAVLIIAICMKTFMSGSGLDSVCSDYTKVIGEVNNNVSEISKLSGNVNDENNKILAEKLKNDLNELYKIKDDLTRFDQNSDEKKQVNDLLALVNCDIEEVQNIIDVISYDKTVGSLENDKNRQEFVMLLNNAACAYNDNSLSKEIIIKNNNYRNIYNLKDNIESINKYKELKFKLDEKIRVQKYKDDLDNANKELMSKHDLNFITESVTRIDANHVAVAGKFYNGIDKTISRILDAMVTVSLKVGDEVVASATSNYEINLVQVDIVPGSMGGNIVLDIKGNFGNKEFDNFSVSVNNIHYKNYKNR